MDGLKITQLCYENLRKPSDTALPYKTILHKIQAVVKKKKLDLALSEQNSLMSVSAWFTPTSANFDISTKLAEFANILLPVRVESRAIDSDWETGEEVPIVNYQVLNTSQVGAVSFYGSPLRMMFRDPVSYVQERQYRIGYESDFTDEIGLADAIPLPEYFSDMISDEATFDLIDLVEDNSPEWLSFVERQNEKLLVKIQDWRDRWKKYKNMFKGKSTIPKRTFWDNRRSRSYYRRRAE